MGFVRFCVSMDKRLVQKLDEKAKHLTISRSEYLRHLALDDLQIRRRWLDMESKSRLEILANPKGGVKNG